MQKGSHHILCNIKINQINSHAVSCYSDICINTGSISNEFTSCTDFNQGTSSHNKYLLYISTLVLELLFYHPNLNRLKFVWCLRQQGLNDNLHLLILDSHSSHLNNLKFCKVMKENNMSIVTILLHTSRIMWPLDSTPFAQFNQYESYEVQ